MKNKWIIPITSYILAIFSFIFGSYDTLWNTLNIIEDLRVPLTVGVSILILLIGHFINTLQIETDISIRLSELEKLVKDTSKNSYLRILNNSDEGLTYLTSKFATTRIVKNTRIPYAEHANLQTSNSKKYVKGLKNLLKDSNIVFREVIVENGKPFSLELESIALQYKSSYLYKAIAKPSSGFINFTIITDIYNESEVILGWITSPNLGFSENCIISRDDRLVAFFNTVFEELWNGAS